MEEKFKEFLQSEEGKKVIKAIVLNVISNELLLTGSFKISGEDLAIALNRHK